MFQVGDFVKLREGIVVGNVYSGYSLSQRMVFDGYTRIARIDWADDTCKVEINDYWYKLPMLVKKTERVHETMENKWLCSRCGAVQEEHEGAYKVDGEYICQDCFEDVYNICSYCGEYHPREESILTVNNEVICENCFSDRFVMCDDCDRAVIRYRSFEVEDERLICEECRDENYRYCGECGRLFRDEDLHEIGDNIYMCSSCADTAGVIGDYHHTRANHFYRANGENTTRFIGVELEVEARGGQDRFNAARDILDVLGRNFIECKHDGSLCDGFEIVTQPATLAYHRLQNYREALEGLISNGMRSHDGGNCGLHFHISKKFFEDENGDQWNNIAKLIVMSHYLWEDIVKFSRRDYNQINDWAKKNDYNEMWTVGEVIDCNDSNRYQAINITNRHTVEFRFMRGTLRYKTFLASLEWVERFTDYAVIHSMEDCFNVTWDKLFSGASPNFKEYALSRGIGIPEIDHDHN